MGLVEIFFSLEKLLLNIDVLGICRPKFYNSKAIFTGTSLLSFSPLRMPNFVHCQCVLVFINGITADFFVMLAMVLFENQDTHLFQNFCKERIMIGRSHPEANRARNDSTIAER